MRTGKDRVELAEVNGTVSIGGVRVRHDDIVIADANGVVVVAREHVADVAAVAQEIERVEGAIMEDIKNGATIGVARKRHGYHTLQRKAS
jgi:regulator of RNase E activity RraA